MSIIVKVTAIFNLIRKLNWHSQSIHWLFIYNQHLVQSALLSSIGGDIIACIYFCIHVQCTSNQTIWIIYTFHLLEAMAANMDTEEGTQTSPAVTIIKNIPPAYIWPITYFCTSLASPWLRQLLSTASASHCRSLTLNWHCSYPCALFHDKIWLEYRLSLNSGLPSVDLACLDRILCSAARLIGQIPKFSHVTSCMLSFTGYLTDGV